MNEEKKLEVQPYQRHIFICTGPRCAPETSPSLYQWLKIRLKDLQLDQGVTRIQRSQSQCLGVCTGGPIAVVYPEGIWYHHLDEQKLERVIREHLVGGRPVREFVFYCQAP